jgi:uncharacterized repeat protein (TIGR03803 family)
MTITPTVILALLTALPRLASRGAEANYTLETLVTFTGTNGILPTAGLLLAKDGNFYGTTQRGGSFMKESDDGTAFKMTPEGNFITLVSFTSGKHPSGELTQGSDGNLYGCTLGGGEFGDGTVFRMSPEGKVTTLYSFSASAENANEGTNGWAPAGSLVQASDRNFYGLTGAYGFSSGGWTVFKISQSGHLTTLFAERANGPPHSSRLTLGRDGNLYGTLGDGIFRVTHRGALKTLLPPANNQLSHLFPCLARGNDRTLYGMTASGGDDGAGILFSLGSGAQIRRLASFSAAIKPQLAGKPSLMQASDGNFYGTALGQPDVIFRLNRQGEFIAIAMFGGTNGISPNEVLVQGKDGNLYGTTMQGPGSAGGTIFRLVLPGVSKPKRD